VFIAKGIPLKFVLPELLVIFRPAEKTTSMPVPETAIHHDYRPVFWKNDIGCAWQVFCVQAISETKFMKSGSYGKFRGGVLRTDSRHHPAAGKYIGCVSHQLESEALSIEGEMRRP